MADDDDPREAEIEAAAIHAGEEVLAAQGKAEEQVQREINAMFSRDRIMAITIMCALLITMPFIIIAVWSSVPYDGVRVVIVIGAVVVLTYNMAAMGAMLREFASDRDFVYRRDVAHIHERKVMRQAAKEAARKR